MNVILLPILAVLIWAFAYRFIGQLIATMGDHTRHYNTDGRRAAEPPVSAALRDFGVLGTPFLVAGAAFGLRFGWAPAFLWILLASTTVGAAVALNQTRGATPPGWGTANGVARIVISSWLALLWAGLAAQSAHALLAFFVLYFGADLVMPLITTKRAELVGGLLLISAIGVLFAALGLSWPLAFTGQVQLILGPFRRLAPVGPLFFYSLLFLILIQKKRQKRLAARPAYGALGSLLLGVTIILIFLAVCVGHPSIPIPRLSAGGLLPALPLLAASLPFAGALAPLGDNPLATGGSARGVYLLIMLQGVAAVGFLVTLLLAFPGILPWRMFFAAHPGAVTLLMAAVNANGGLMGLLGLGPWVGQLLLTGLLLLTAASLESHQCQLIERPIPKAPLQPLMATALLGGLLWLGHGLTARDQVAMGALLGIAAASAVIWHGRALPRFVVSLSLVLLVLTDIGLIVIGATDPSGHPIRTALSAAVMTIEAVAAALLWRARFRPKDHASRHSGNQP